VAPADARSDGRAIDPAGRSEARTAGGEGRRRPADILVVVLAITMALLLGAPEAAACTPTLFAVGRPTPDSRLPRTTLALRQRDRVARARDAATPTLR
jgi:hypothetical protein